MKSENEQALALRRFDFYPNRGVHFAYQPNTPRNVDDCFDPILCTHGVSWTTCKTCSKEKP